VIPKNIKLLYLRDFFVGLRFFAAIQVIYFVHITGSFALAMSLFSIATISQALLEIPTGIFSDKVGRRLTTVLGTLSAVVSIIFYAIGTSYTFLLIGALLEGLARSLGSGNHDAYIYDSLKEIGKEDDYHRYYGKNGTVWEVSWGIAAFVGGFLASRSFALALWLSVATQVIAFVISLYLTEPRAHSKSDLHPYAHLKESIRGFKNNRKLRLLTFASVWRESISESSYQFLPAFMATLWPVWAIGLQRTAVSVISATSYYFGDRVVDRYKSLPTVLWTFLINRTINILSFGIPTGVSPASLAMTATTYGPVNIAQESLNQKEFTDEQRATMGSLISILMSIGFGVIAFVIGYVADIIGPGKILLIGELLMLPVLIIYWMLFKHERNIGSKLKGLV
jgi:MFS family permease